MKLVSSSDYQTQPIEDIVKLVSSDYQTQSIEAIVKLVSPDYVPQPIEAIVTRKLISPEKQKPIKAIVKLIAPDYLPQPIEVTVKLVSPNQSHLIEDRIKYLLLFPSLLQVAVNTANTCMLKGLIKRTFINDCIYINSFSSPLNGRSNVCDSYIKMFRIAPDLYMKCSNPHLHDNIITFNKVITGTTGQATGFISSDKTEILLNLLKVPKWIMDENLKIQFAKFKECMDLKKLFSFQMKVEISLFLNDNGCILKRFAKIVRFEISEAHY